MIELLTSDQRKMRWCRKVHPIGDGFSGTSSVRGRAHAWTLMMFHINVLTILTSAPFLSGQSVIMDFHLFLSSSDSKSVHQTNTPGDFMVELPRTKELEGAWECALIEFQLTGENVPFDPFCLCTDVCEDSCVGDFQLPILRRLTMKGRKKDAQFQFELPQYIPVKRNQIKRIQIYIRTTRHRTVTVASGELTCTLHFRHKQ